MLNILKDEKAKIYAVYIATFELSYDIQRKNTLLTALMGGADWSWRVVGITVDALELFAANNFKMPEVRRAHKIARIDTARSVFEIPTPLSSDAFFELFWLNDETVIATKPENKKNAVLSEVIPISFDEGLFRCNKKVGFRYRQKKEGMFLRALHFLHVVAPRISADSI